MWKIFILCILCILNANCALHLSQLQNYFDDLQTFQAKFTQIDQESQEKSSGELFFDKKLQKLKIHYQKPQEISLLFKKDQIIYLQHELNSIHHLNVKKQENIFLHLFQSDILNKINQEYIQDSLIYFEILYTANAKITLIFSQNPFELTKIAHKNNHEDLLIKLNNIIKNQPINPQEFILKTQDKKFQRNY